MDYRKRTRVTGEARVRAGEELAKRYHAGESIREIAGAIDRSYGFVHRVLSETPGVVLRGRGGITRGPKAKQRVKSAAA